MTTYRLPDGTEATTVPNMTVTHVGYAWVQHPQLGVMQIAGSLLTEVKPPLPPEPHGNCCVLVENDLADADVEPDIYRRRNALWWPAGYSRVAGGGYTWAQLHGRGKVTVLRPDPADDAPALPLYVPTSHAGYKLILRESSHGYLCVAIGDAADVGITVHGARQAAAALWAWAAREVE